MIKVENAKSSAHQSLDATWLKVLRRRNELGFLQIAESPDWENIAARLASLQPTSDALILGIGGSSLGMQVINHCFAGHGRCRMHFLESPDPYTWQRLKNAQLAKNKNIVIVSKSGNTLETLAWVEQLAAADLLKGAQVTVIASPGDGHLQTWARQNNVDCLWIPTNVGGRFSVLTAAGMFPAGLLGLNLNGFREGARWALEHPDVATAVAAEIIDSWANHAWITQMWTYSENLRVFGEWWQQLWGESLAKKFDRSGAAAPRVSTPMACLGPRDQHSLVQQLMEGARDKQIFILRVNNTELSGEKFTGAAFSGMPFHSRSLSLGQILAAEADAFKQSLNETGIRSCTLHLERADEQGLGALFMFWQMVTALLGEHLNIDAFNQPGVELGKKYAAQILRG